MRITTFRADTMTCGHICTTSDCQAHIQQTSFVRNVSHVQNNILTYMALTHALSHSCYGSLNVCLHPGQPTGAPT